ncbi:MAG: leucine-rich repeat domain-containing protein, partial [Alistipes sp.]|nr:leucine-rich repeat domain-containing protein [Alistipes sp.]
GNIVEPYQANFGGAEILSNTYEDGKGVIKFNAPVTEIGYYAFYHCRTLTSITIPDSVTKIGNDAFSDCSSLTSITIPDSVTSILNNQFKLCRSLTAFYGKFASEDNRCLIVDGELKSFAIGCGVTEYTIPDGVTTIVNNAFYNCSSLTSITIPDSVTTIGVYNPFENCSGLTAFYGKFASDDNRCLIVDGVLKSFAQAGLTEYTIPDGVTKIGDLAFHYCTGLTSITIPDSVTEIGGYGFSGCSGLTSITISDNVTIIEGYAFSDCNSLTSITIPDNVTIIEGYAFSYCRSLTSVYCRATTPPALGYNVFYYILENLTAIYVPRASVEAYKAAEKWSDYADLIEPYDF